MGQSLVSSSAERDSAENTEIGSQSREHLSAFVTELGWFGLLGRDAEISGLTIGHAGPGEVRAAIARRHPTPESSQPFEECDWFPEMRSRLERYARGEPIDFADCRLKLPRMTQFQSEVVEATRAIGYGDTLTYAQLAAKVDRPRATRAVGNVMASNRLPILVPCHRVVATGGGLGGFSAPQGIDLKKIMLRMEAETSGSI